MKRRALFGLTLLAPVGAGASWLRLRAARVGDGGLRAGALDGPEAEILRFVAQAAPRLGLRIATFASKSEIRDLLRTGKLSFGSFETAIELADASLNPERELASAGATVTLPLGWYGHGRRSLSELVPGTRVVVSTTPSSQARGLLVLYQYGLVDFDQALGPTVRLSDVRANPRRLELVAVADEHLQDEWRRGAVVALEFGEAERVGLSPARNALALEDGYSSFAQVLTVQRADAERPPTWLQELLTAYRAPAVKRFILERFRDSVRRAW